MSRPTSEGSPLWELVFKESTEVEACYKFWSVAYMARRRRRAIRGVVDGHVVQRETYSPVAVGQNPAGFLGCWTLVLAEDVYVPQRPDALPSVQHKLIVWSHDMVDGPNIETNSSIVETFCEESFVRPPMRVHLHNKENQGAAPQRKPKVEMVDPTALLDYCWSAGLEKLARYAAWLEVAQEALVHRPQRCRPNV